MPSFSSQEEHLLSPQEGDTNLLYPTVSVLKLQPAFVMIASLWQKGISMSVFNTTPQKQENMKNQRLGYSLVVQCMLSIYKAWVLFPAPQKQTKQQPVQTSS
jgi:hypothetical protein